MTTPHAPDPISAHQSDDGMRLEAMAELSTLLQREPRLSEHCITHPHPLVAQVRRDDRIVLIVPARVWQHARSVLKPFAGHFGEAKGALVILGALDKQSLDEALHRGLTATLPAQPTSDQLVVAIHGALELLAARSRSRTDGQSIDRYRYELGELLEIAQVITTERDLDKLLALILAKSRFITGADAGSIYVVEGDDVDIARRALHFKLAQNDSVTFDASDFCIPVNEHSMSGYAALHKETLNIPDVYQLPTDAPYGFDRSFDQKVGYRTRSMLSIALRSQGGEVNGVLQLINRKVDPNAKLLNLDEDLAEVVAFDQRCEDLMTTLASLAGIALENAILYAENKQMLEGFVRASVDAIEQRDPTTSGHSIRVAEMSIELAKVVERQENGLYRDVSWSKDDLKELEYASLLHDFGKIGVREEVLVKAKKLYPKDLALVHARFALAYRSAEVELLHRKVDALKRKAPPEVVAAIDEEFEQRRAALAAALEMICSANEPKVLRGGDYAAIEAIARLSYTDRFGKRQALLSAKEVECLSVPRGSLTPDEFDEIRSHVSHTYEFLSAIPWGRNFRRVAQIAGAHHERLDGTGYPKRLHGPEIPLQSKIMAVSDIFDALTAADRPYKKAVPLERALDILGMEVKQSHIDGELVRIFTDAKVWTAMGQAPLES